MKLICHADCMTMPYISISRTGLKSPSLVTKVAKGQMIYIPSIELVTSNGVVEFISITRYKTFNNDFRKLKDIFILTFLSNDKEVLTLPFERGIEIYEHTSTLIIKEILFADIEQPTVK